MSTHRVILLGVPIDPLTPELVLERLRDFLRSGTQHHVMTPNSEMLVEATKNSRFLSTLQSADLNLPDSVGLLLAARLTGQRLPARVTGVDTVEKFCSELTEDHPVYFLGAAEGVAERAASTLGARNPRLRIAGTYAGSPREEEALAIVKHIADSGAHILFVAFGAPVQDLWIADHLADLPSVRIAMGVGGTFDFLAGHRRRAPRILRILALEWLWRLILEPHRIGRIVRAVMVFPFLVLRYRAKGPERRE